MTTEPTIPSQPWGMPARAVRQTSGGTLGALRTNAILQVIFALIAVISPFMTYATVEGDSVNAFDSGFRDMLSNGDKFANGGYVVVAAAVVALAVGTVFLSTLSAGRMISRSAVGWMAIACGIVTAGAAGTTYNAVNDLMDEINQSWDVGIGLGTSSLMGIAMVVMGVITLIAKPESH